MHASLRSTNLLRLPGVLKAKAQSAARGNMDDFEFLAVNVLDSDLPSTKSNLLPLFYDALSDLPDESRRRDLDEALWQKIRRTMLAFQGIISLNDLELVPAGAVSDIWARAYPFVLFLDSIAETLTPTINIGTARSVVVGMIDLCSSQGGATLAFKVFDTPRIFRIIGRSWNVLIDEADKPSLFRIARVISQARVGAESTQAAYLEDLRRGVGGTWRHLAIHTVRHLRCIVLAPDGIAKGDEEPLVSLSAITFLVGHPFHTYPEFREGLWNNGFMKAITVAYRAVAAVAPLSRHWGTIPEDLFIALANSVIYNGARVRLIEALDAGFLPTLFAYARLRQKDTSQQTTFFAEQFDGLLRQILPAYTVYHSVLTQLRASLLEVKDLDPMVHFRFRGTDELAQIWMKFVGLVFNRLRVVEDFNRGMLTASKACDEVKCSKIAERRNMKRCAGCLTVYYCSANCQKRDWSGIDGHRKFCQKLRRIHHEDARAFRAKDRAFFRALLNFEYDAEQQETTYLQLVRFYSCQPAGTAALPHVHINMTQSSQLVAVLPSLDPRMTRELAAGQTKLYGDDIERVQRKCVLGTGEIHLLGILDTSTTLWRVVHLHREARSRGLLDGIKALAKSIPAGVLPPGTSQSDPAVQMALERFRPAVRMLIARYGGLVTH
ncbi:MYND-type domain-containing protein [Mycena kentingensis (nom. inval.)]|nr:MYND-type domain-containing protein [Mycena kentingensis (nom. inval.)]